MFVTIVSVRIFVLSFARVEKNIKKYKKFIIVAIFVIFNRGVLCPDIGKMSGNFGSIVFLCRSK